MRTVTARVAVLALLALSAADAARAAQAPALPFPEVPLPVPDRHPHALAYVSLATGVGLMASSFVFANRANHSYNDYLIAVDSESIERLYDRSVLNDRFSSGSLLAGEALIGFGLYLGFLRQTPDTRVSLRLGPQRCALALRF